MLYGPQEQRMTAAITTILVPTDFSDASKDALAYGRLLAVRFGANLHIVHVCEEPMMAAAWTEGYAVTMLQLRDQIKESSERQLAALVVVLGDVPASTEVLSGKPATAIVEAARARKASVIVMGTHGFGGLNHLLLGSVAERVVRLAPCPVLTVRQQLEAVVNEAA
jgi:universal stress protein A